MKCLICEYRPARIGVYCHNCARAIETERRRRKPEIPVKYLTYRGFVVGLYPNRHGTLSPRLLRCESSKLPKSKTLNLDIYLPGFTREQIKRFKRCVLKLAQI
jgi:hypothetical protein